jgi:hypothetical protein
MHGQLRAARRPRHACPLMLLRSRRPTLSGSHRRALRAPAPDRARGRLRLGQIRVHALAILSRAGRPHPQASAPTPTRERKGAGIVLGWRARTVTSSPASRSAATTCVPMNPVPPVMSTRMRVGYERAPGEQSLEVPARMEGITGVVMNVHVRAHDRGPWGRNGSTRGWMGMHHAGDGRGPCG